MPVKAPWLTAAGVKKILKSGEPGLLLVVAAALIDARGRVLVQKRPPGLSMAGLWEFPGGKIEVDETPEAALARELGEELGIDPGPLVPLAFASEALGDRHLVMLLYVCRKWTGTPTALYASALQWVHPHELHALAMPPADLPLIASVAAAVAQGVGQ